MESKMVVNVADALSSYRSVVKGLEGNNNAASGTSFGDILGGVLDKTVDSLKEADKVSLAAVHGKATLNEIVTAVSSAETALQTIVSIRDRLVGAYQELMRSGV
jgi:flagellar hook-basal body complex protein FliE